MKKAKVIDEFTGQEACTISMSNLPRKNDCVALIEESDMVSYFKVDKVLRANKKVHVIITPVIKDWALGFHEMYGREMHFFFADAEYASFQNEDVG